MSAGIDVQCNGFVPGLDLWVRLGSSAWWPTLPPPPLAQAPVDTAPTSPVENARSNPVRYSGMNRCCMLHCLQLPASTTPPYPGTRLACPVCGSFVAWRHDAWERDGESKPMP